jgi:Zn-dependent metalloprotease
VVTWSFHQAKDGSFKSASLTLSRSANVNRTPKVSVASATSKALAKGLKAEGKPTLVIEARKGAPRLAYLVTTVGTQPDGTPSNITTTIDALTGAKLVSEQHIETATGDGQSLYSGTVPLQTTAATGGFTLTDPSTATASPPTPTTRPTRILCQLFGLGCPTPTRFTDADNHWGTGTNANRATAAVDAHYGAATTFDYYKNVHGRNGIFNDGKGVPSRVHYGTNYVNAFWDGKQMTYGDGDNVVAGPLVSIDVAGHEMSHGVTEHTANLTYSGESGGLNEATSDILGTLVEFYSNNASDPGDYYIGERIMKDRPALRFMDKPSRDGNSPDCWSSGVGNLDVHYSSGIANHFAYLLAEGSGAKTIGGLPAQLADLQRLDRHRHRPRQARQDLVPRADDVHDQRYDVRPGPDRDPQRGHRPVRREQHRARHSRRRLVGGQRQLIAPTSPVLSHWGGQDR